MQKGRVEYLDFIKGISIILVVFCHRVALSDNTILGNIVMAAAWAAVPNFFFVTGGVMHQMQSLNWRKYIARLVQTYVVLCVWKVLYFIFFSFVQEIVCSKVELVKYIFLFGDISGVDTGPMWFMYAYLAVQLFFPISYFLFRGGKDGKRILLFVLVVLFVNSFLTTACNFFFENLSKHTGCNLLQVSISTAVPFGGWPHMLFFFIMGAFLFQYREKIKDYLSEKYRKWIPGVLFVIGLAGLVFVKYCAAETIRWEGIYITNGYSRIFTMLMSLGLYLILLNWKIRKVGHFIAKYIGTETMGIFYLHMPLLALFQIKLAYYYDLYASFGLNILKTAAAIAICMVITTVMRKIPLIKKLVK